MASFDSSLNMGEVFIQSLLIVLSARQCEASGAPEAKASQPLLLKEPLIKDL